MLIFPKAVHADPVIWGGDSANPAGGILDPRVILTTNTPSGFTYQDVHDDFDLTVFTSGLNGTGLALFQQSPTQSESAWWFEGGTRSTTSQSINYSTVQFRFTDPEAATPVPVTGVHFRIQDAEEEERFRNFSYIDATGATVPVSLTSSIITSSHGSLGIHLSDGSFDSGVHYEPGTQTNKWIDVNLGNIPISGFSFQTGRSLSSYGSVEMTGLGNITPFLDVSSGQVVTPTGTYRGLGSISASTHGTLAMLLYGTPTTTRTVTMGFDIPGTVPDTVEDRFQAQNGGVHSDVLTLSGNAGDKFVLQLSYDPASLPVGTDESTLFLSWYDPVTMTLRNAVEGNTTYLGELNSPHPVVGAFDPATDFVLGYYGVDTYNKTVWAVIDHNSNFAVLPAPEPTSAILAICGTVPLLARRRRARPVAQGQNGQSAT